MTGKICVDDFVWAKLTGFPPWPSIIVEPESDIPEKPHSDSEKKYFWVYFFGSHNYSWVEERYIKPYQQFKDKFKALKKQKKFMAGVQEVEEHLQHIKNDPNYVVIGRKKYRGEQIVDVKRPKSISSSIKEETTRQVDYYSETISAQISPSNKIFGVVGIGMIGKRLVRNLINSGHEVNIWTRCSRKCDQLLTELGDSGRIEKYLSSRGVIIHSDIIFFCVSDHLVAKYHIESNFEGTNVSDEDLNDKGIVVMTSMDPATSRSLREMVETRGAKFLEAQIQESMSERADQKFCILTAGNIGLYRSCQSCFYAMGGSTIFLGEAGNAAKFNVILQLMKATYLVALAEGLTLAERCGIVNEKFLDVFNLTGLSSPYLRAKADIILKNQYLIIDQSVKNIKTDIELGLKLSNDVDQPMPLASTAHEMFKHCCRLKYADHSAAAVFLTNSH